MHLLGLGFFYRLQAVPHIRFSFPTMTEQTEKIDKEERDDYPAPAQEFLKHHRIQLRPAGQLCSGATVIHDLRAGETVMVQTDHGLEPARIANVGPLLLPMAGRKTAAACQIIRRATQEEIGKFDRLLEREKEGFQLCRKLIGKHQLTMKLIRVERYFNGSKIIFYFTAEHRVDFRNLVKDLVQEFRTRVEMRQIGVRHETKLIGGLGCCGRELCCASHIKNFAPVSIKMAKEQDVPLNPSKISGICNRLLCCLTYEFAAYHKIKKHMPKVGKTIKLNNRICRIIGCNTLEETITVTDPDDSHKTMIISRNEWEPALQQTKTPNSDK
jgi:cell fate regulator YaaT (PSP1 superfamily)